MKVLFIGGTGQISFDCVHGAVRAGHDVHVYNRGHHNAGLPEGVTFHVGDVHDDAAYFPLAEQRFDVVCQFRLFHPDEMARDLKLFAGRCDQYVFISTASAYQKPPTSHVITEATPLENLYWEYSRNKIAMEQLLRDQTALPWTIVRPSHTTRHGWITPTGHGTDDVHRLKRALPVLLPGDGTSLWTFTAAADFAPPFVKLLGNDAAIGEDFHLTSDHAHSWNDIFAATARAIDAPPPNIVHVPTDTLVKYHPAWAGPLLGDKTWTTLFDNAKIKAVVGDFACEPNLDALLRGIAARNPDDLDARGNAPYHALVGRIAAEQSALGA